jgi:hypothetical protein
MLGSGVSGEPPAISNAQRAELHWKGSRWEYLAAA